MKLWQRYWLYGVFLFFSFHLFRDISQDLGIKNMITTALVKANQSNVPDWYWLVFSNSYIIEVTEVILSFIALKRNKFALIGNLTILLVIYFAIAWLVYWFLL